MDKRFGRPALTLALRAVPLPEGEGCARSKSLLKKQESRALLPKKHQAAALSFLCLLWFLPSSFAQAIYAENQIPANGVEIEYTVSLKNPVSHIYDVEMAVRGIRDLSVSVSMPAWSPGMYRIENYARNVQDFHAANMRNQPLNWEQTDKQTWRIAKQAADAHGGSIRIQNLPKKGCVFVLELPISDERPPNS